MWINSEDESRLLMTVIARIDVKVAGIAAAHGEDTPLVSMMIVDGIDHAMLLVARVIVTLMIELPYAISELIGMETVATALTAEVGAGQLVVVMTGTGTAAGVETEVLNGRKIELEIARVQRMNGTEIVIIALAIAAGIEIGIETGIESVTGTWTENAKGIGIIDVAVTILGLVHELDADDPALPPAPEIETKIELEIETEIESEIVIKNGTETETKNKTGAGSEKETVTASGEDPSLAFRIPLENRLARDGVPPALLTSTAMCPQRAIGADPLEGGSDLQNVLSEMIVEGSWRLIGTYPAARGNVKRLETERKRKRYIKKRKAKKGKIKAQSFLIAERMTAGYGNLAPVKGEAEVVRYSSLSVQRDDLSRASRLYCILYHVYYPTFWSSIINNLMVITINSNERPAILLSRSRRLRSIKRLSTEGTLQYHAGNEENKDYTSYMHCRKRSEVRSGSMGRSRSIRSRCHSFLIPIILIVSFIEIRAATGTGGPQLRR
jgi:hypothetical protein